MMKFMFIQCSKTSLVSLGRFHCTWIRGSFHWIFLWNFKQQTQYTSQSSSGRWSIHVTQFQLPGHVTLYLHSSHQLAMAIGFWLKSCSNSIPTLSNIQLWLHKRKITLKTQIFNQFFLYTWSSLSAVRERPLNLITHSLVYLILSDSDRAAWEPISDQIWSW